MSQLVHDILGKLTTIRAAVWDAQTRYPQEHSLEVAAQELVEAVKLVESLKDPD